MRSHVRSRDYIAESTYVWLFRLLGSIVLTLHSIMRGGNSGKAGGCLWVGFANGEQEAPPLPDGPIFLLSAATP